MRVLVACECSGTVRRAFRALGHDAWSCDLLPADDGEDENCRHLQGDALYWMKGYPKTFKTPNYQTTWDGGKNDPGRQCFDYHTIPDESRPWDMMIAHPPCDYLTNSAAWAYKDPDYERYPGIGYHQQVKPGTLVGAARRAAREEAIDFFLSLWNARIARVCIENPIGYMNTHPELPDALPDRQIIQPNQFGEDASKATVLWLRGLPPLLGTENYPARIVEWPKDSGKMVFRWSNQTDSGQNKLPPTKDRASIRAVTYQGIAKAMAAQWTTP